MSLPTINYEDIQGRYLEGILSTLKDFRATQFSAPPYSYAFDEYAEDEYLKEYVRNEHSICVTASCCGQIVGLITGMPLTSSGVITYGAKTNFQLINEDIDNYFYICEVIVLPEFRSKQIGRRLIGKIEDYSIKLNKTNIALLSIGDKNNDSLDTKGLWFKAGYKKTNIFESHHWPTYMEDGSVKDISHNLVYWVKRL